MVITHPYTLEPSVICCDLCNLEAETKKLKEAGITALHIDVLDGAFSPSLPHNFILLYNIKSHLANGNKTHCQMA